MNREELERILRGLIEAKHLQPVLDADGNAVKTFCNIAVCQVLEWYGFKEFNGKLANTIIARMEEHPSFAKVGPETAHNLARQGKLVIAGRRADPHGHIACVYPADSMVVAGKWRCSCPVLANVGKRNAILGANYCFKDLPVYYAFIDNPAPKVS